MEPEQRKSAFVQLGQIFLHLGNNEPWPGFASGLNEEEYAHWQHLIETAHHHNGWFTVENVRRALKAWGENLKESNLNQWLENYNLASSAHTAKKKVGIVMAGNIPMVGFHDLLSVLITGHTAIVKLSSDDKLLIPLAVKTLAQFEPEIEKQVQFTERLKDIDAVIATGSNNTGRYFEHYFSKYPNIIRRNRNSMAIVEDSTSAEDLAALGDDIFAFFGLGCRNVTKVFLPSGFDIDRLFKAIYSFHEIVNHNKYANNYDYHKALYLLNREPLLDNGFILLREHPQLHSALGTLHYEFYESSAVVEQYMKDHEDEIQCIVADKKWAEDAVEPGFSQRPALWDYADRIDTLEFLRKL